MNKATFETQLTVIVVVIMFLILRWLGTHPDTLSAIVVFLFGAK